MAPTTRSSSAVHEESTTYASAVRDIEGSAQTTECTELNSVSELSIPDTDLASNSMGAETSSDTLSSQGPAAELSIDQAIVDIAICVIKGSGGGVKLQSEGKTYYGVEKRFLRHLVHSKRPTILLAGILAQVVEACDVAKAPQYRLKKALSDFKSALWNTARRRWDYRCRVYYGHARRMMARLVVMYQGYYGVHPDEVDTFKTIGGVGKGPATPPPSGITA
ncbi:hypothetical protein QFC20_007626, partial [Naganishia adeliensis]